MFLQYSWKVSRFFSWLISWSISHRIHVTKSLSMYLSYVSSHIFLCFTCPPARALSGSMTLRSRWQCVRKEKLGTPNEQCSKPWLFRIILPNYMGVIRSQYKDPYKPISIMECHMGFERCSNGFGLKPKGVPVLVWRWDPRTDGSVVHGPWWSLLLSPKNRVVGPLPNGIFMAWKETQKHTLLI